MDKNERHLKITWEVKYLIGVKEEQFRQNRTKFLNSGEQHRRDKFLSVKQGLE